MANRSLRLFLRALPGFCTSLSAVYAAEPEFSPQVWMNPGVYSYHFDRSENLRENNVGLGLEVLVAADHALMAGTFINSNNERTYYGAYQWRPLHWQPAGITLSAGILVGAFDGYPYRNGGWFPAAMPLLSIEGRHVGANFTIVPDIKDRLHGALAVQIKLRVW